MDTHVTYIRIVCAACHTLFYARYKPQHLCFSWGRAPATYSVVWARTGNQRLIGKYWDWDLNPHSHSIILNTNIKSTLLQEC